jgi:hypothetical protein
VFILSFLRTPEKKKTEQLFVAPSPPSPPSLHLSFRFHLLPAAFVCVLAL